MEGLVNDLDEEVENGKFTQIEEKYKKKYPKKSRKIEDILSDSSRIAHRHKNQEVLGESRAEKHISEFALKTTKDKAFSGIFSPIITVS